MRLLVIMDPVEAVQPATDTSFALIRAAQARGHEVAHCQHVDVSLLDGQLWSRARSVKADGDPESPLVLGAPEALRLERFDAILVRTDPPFDQDYLHLTLLLGLVGDGPLIVNEPRGLREANEKLYACRFPDLMPPTVVSADESTLRGFAEAHGAAVLKPLHGHGGIGVHLLRPDDPNAAVILHSLTGAGRHHVMAQRFLPQVYEGDKRILVLDGQPLGAVLRRPSHGDFRANIGVGGKVEASEVDDDDQRLLAALAPSLRADGLWFVGLDVIGGQLTELNVTSPTGIRQLARLSGGQPDHQFVAWLEERVRTRSARR